MRSISRRRTPALVASTAFAAAAVTVLAGGPPAQAAATQAAATQAAATQAAAAAPSGALLDAMTRDLGLTRAQALQRIRFQDGAASTSAKVAAKVGSAYAGSWVDARSNTLFVAATSPAARRVAAAAGATAVPASHSLTQLNGWSGKLAAQLRSAPAGSIVSSYVDVTTNRLVVEARTAHRADAARLLAAAGVPASGVTVTTTGAQPRPLIDVVGGNPYWIGRSRCSVGFSVYGGFVTAGHCRLGGPNTTSPTGTFAGASFPTNDYGFVAVAAGNTLIGAVNNYAGGRVAVAGSTPAAIGASVCRSGSTTGWRCGTLQAYNATVYYGGYGYVYQLIRTNVCAEPGDSGGSLLAGTQAQGVTSGGSGDCRRGGTTYFQPVNEILSAYRLTLVR